MIRQRASALALVAVALALVSAACGAELPEGSPASKAAIGSALPPDATALEVLEASRKAMAKVSSYRFSGSLSGWMEDGIVHESPWTGAWVAPDRFRDGHHGPSFPNYESTGHPFSESVSVGGCSFFRTADPDDGRWVSVGCSDQTPRGAERLLALPDGVAPRLVGEQVVDGVAAYRVAWDNETTPDLTPDVVKALQDAGVPLPTDSTTVEVSISKEDLRVLQTRREVVGRVPSEGFFVDGPEKEMVVLGGSVTIRNYFDYDTPISIELPANSVELADL